LQPGFHPRLKDSFAMTRGKPQFGNDHATAFAAPRSGAVRATIFTRGSCKLRDGLKDRIQRRNEYSFRHSILGKIVERGERKGGLTATVKKETHTAWRAFLMNPKSLIILAAAFAVTVTISGCLPPAPTPINERSAAIGVSVEKVWASFGFATEYPERVYFIRWSDSRDVTEQEEIIASNFSRGTRVYLLNAKPGRYSAVAATDFLGASNDIKTNRVVAQARPGRRWSATWRENVGLWRPLVLGGKRIAAFSLPTPRPAYTAPPAVATLVRGWVENGAGGSPLFALARLPLAESDVDGGDGDNLDNFTAFTTYFSEQLIEATTVEIAAGEFKMIGSFLVEMRPGVVSADKAQKYFHRAIEPNMEDPYGFKLLGATSSYVSRAKLLKRTVSRENEIALLKGALEDLRDTPWGERVQRRLEAAR
jgi:hypothetical protein